MRSSGDRSLATVTLSADDCARRAFSKKRCRRLFRHVGREMARSCPCVIPRRSSRQAGTHRKLRSRDRNSSGSQIRGVWYMTTTSNGRDGELRERNGRRCYASQPHTRTAWTDERSVTPRFPELHASILISALISAPVTTNRKHFSGRIARHAQVPRPSTTCREQAALNAPDVRASESRCSGTVLIGQLSFKGNPYSGVEHG